MTAGEPDPSTAPDHVGTAAEAVEEARRWALQAETSARRATRRRSHLFATLMGVLLGSTLTFSLPKLWDRLGAGPTPIDKSPGQLIQWYSTFENEAQAQALASRLYYGKYVLASGPISKIGKSANSPFAAVYLPSTVCFVGFDDAARLTKGEQVVILGRIDSITGAKGVVQLSDCRIKSASAPTEPPR